MTKAKKKVKRNAWQIEWTHWNVLIERIFVFPPKKKSYTFYDIQSKIKI